MHKINRNAICAFGGVKSAGAFLWHNDLERMEIIMRIVMLGAPGAGKGTQAIRIAGKYGIPHVSTGDIFRANIKNQTALGKKAKAYMDQGQLVPDSLTIEIVEDRLQQDDCRGGYVLDGFPRTIPQAEALTEVLAKAGEAIDYAIDIEVPDEAIVTRMSGRRSCPGCGATYHVLHNAPKHADICDECGTALARRADDEPETVQRRLFVYHEETQPMIDYYQKQGVLYEIDGTQDMNQVFEDIIGILEADR